MNGVVTAMSADAERRRDLQGAAAVTFHRCLQEPGTMRKHTRCIGRFQRPVAWVAIGDKLLFPDWFCRAGP
jgi:hypothetical protein